MYIKHTFSLKNTNIHVPITQVKKENKATSHQESSPACSLPLPGYLSPDFQDNQDCFSLVFCHLYMHPF